MFLTRSSGTRCCYKTIMKPSLMLSETGAAHTFALFLAIFTHLFLDIFDIIHIHLLTLSRITMEVYHFPHFGASVHVALFHDVQNAASLRARLVKASTMPGEEGVTERAAVNFAFIDARLVRHMRY
jgi:hypothetical protein